MTTIPEVLRDATQRFAEREAIVDGATRMTFSELGQAADRVAKALLEIGVERGDRVALWAPNSARWIEASFGIYLAGAVLVPLNTRLKAPEAVHVITTARARVLIIASDFFADHGGDVLEELTAAGGLASVEHVVALSGQPPSGAIDWDRFVAAGATISDAAVREGEAGIADEDLCDVIFTSGTTGAPKGAMLCHGPSVQTYRIWSELVGLREGDRYLVVYPFFHTAGLKSGVLACVLMGATVLPQAVFDVPEVMRTVSRERVSVLPGPPTVFQSILSDPSIASFDLSSLRLSVTGAAVVPVSIIERMYNELHFENVVTGYGLTETTGTVSMCRHDDPPEVIANTVGRPLPRVEVRVVDDHDVDVEPKAPGEILVRGFNVMAGYFDDPAATDAAFVDGWLRTGDIGFVDDGGNIHITDRKKDMFIVGGFNAYPAEIEGIMSRHDAIAQVAVVGAPDERLGEVGVAFVVPRSDSTIDAHELTAWCRERLANYKVPRRIEVVDALPLNPSGKVMKDRLREQAPNR